MLNAEFPLLKPDAMKKAFDPDISSWSRQLNLATQLFLQDVEKSTTTKDIGYTLVRRDRCSPAVNAKAASIIYSGLRNYTERAEAAEALYKERLQALLEADTDGEPSDDVTASGPKVYRMTY